MTKAAPAHAYALENIITALVEPEIVTIYGDTGFVREPSGHRWCGTAGSITRGGIDRELAAELPSSGPGTYAGQHGWPVASDTISIADAVGRALDGLLAVVPARPELAVAMLHHCRSCRTRTTVEHDADARGGAGRWKDAPAAGDRIVRGR